MDLSELLGHPSLAGTRWGVEVRGPAGRVGADVRRLLRTASLGKVFTLVEVADRIERGQIDPAQPVSRDRVGPVADSGLWQHLATDALPLVDVALLVGAVSDNWAANALLDLVGLPAVQERARTLVPGGSTLHDLVRDARGPADPPTLSEGCAADWVALVDGLAAGTVVGPAVSARVRGWLATGSDLSMVASALLLDPLAHVADDRGVRLWNKTGTDGSVRADTGVVDGPAGRVAWAALCNWTPGDDRPRAAVMATMRAIGEEVARLATEPAGDPVVRRLGADDWAAFREVRLRALADAPDSFASTLADAEARPETAWRDLLTRPGPRLLAFVGDRPVAMGGLTLPAHAPDAFVWGMWVDPAWRGRGLAVRILEQLLAEARAIGRDVVLDVTEGNQRARQLYESRGFTPTGEWRPLREGSALRVETLRWHPT